MAIARLAMKVGKAGKAAPHAAYIAREGQYAGRLEQGEVLEATEAGNMPAWAQANAQEFWKAADANERANGTTYREMEIALPRELSPDDRVALVRDWVAQEIGDRHAYQWAIHVPKAADGGEQPHVHLMFSERQRDGIERDPEQTFKRYNAKAPEKGGARKGYGDTHDGLKGPERKAARVDDLKALRGRWADACNQALERAGKGERIDMRSYAAQGVAELAEAKQLPSEWRDPEKRGNVIEFRAAKAEQRAAVAEVVRQMPNPAKLIDLERERERRTWEAMPLAELRTLAKATASPGIDALIQQQPKAGIINQWMADALKREKTAQAEIDRHTGPRDAWQKAHPIRAWVHAKGIKHGHAAKVDAWLATQEQAKAAALAEQETVKAEVKQALPELRAVATAEHDQRTQKLASINAVLQPREQAAKAERSAKWEAERSASRGRDDDRGMSR